jgi:enoyl-CoA hydratase/carnithine racemase
MQDTIGALRELNENPDTIFTVITGEGRFFSAGADVKGRSVFYVDFVKSMKLMIAQLLAPPQPSIMPMLQRRKSHTLVGLCPVGIFFIFEHRAFAG